jgi:hypothetical protein
LAIVAATEIVHGSDTADVTAFAGQGLAMNLGSSGRLVTAILLSIAVDGATFSAQPTQPYHTLTFAELTVGAAINAMAPDGHGGSWFGGQTCSAALPTTASAVQRTMTSGCHGMLGRLAADGAITYLTYLGGTHGAESVLALAVDAAGNVYAAGQTTSSDFPTTADSYDRVCGNDGTCTIYRYAGFAGRFEVLPASDGFVTELAAAGDRMIYSTFIGGSDADAVTGVAVDASGQIHVTGYTISTDFPVTAGALQTAWSPEYDPDDDPLNDGFYARIDSSRASLGYGTYLGGTGNDWGTGVAVDAHGDAYVTGNTTATNFPVLNAARPVHSSDSGYPYTSTDAFLARFAADGAVYSTYVGGSSSDYGNAIAVTGPSAFLAGQVCSADFPGVSDPDVTQCAAYVAELNAADGTVTRTVTLHNSGGWDRAMALAVDADLHAYVTGFTDSIKSASFPTTPDAYQSMTAASASSGNTDAFLSIIDVGAETPSLLYSTYLGGNDEEQGYAIAPDGTGGAFIGGYSRTLGSAASTFPSQTSQPQPPAEGPSQSFAAHVAVVPTSGGSAPDVVLYARNAAPIAGGWQIVADSTAAGGARIWLPDAGAGKLASAAASPANYFELTFDAPAGVPFHLWLRMRAQAESWQNDSVFVQFSDSVDASGNPAWRIGGTSASVVSLEDCSGCGEQGWGWNDNGYDAAGTPVVFATSGPHTVRIQQREDGISIDQIVLSPSTYLTSAPGTNKNDATILAAPADQNEVVLYAADLAATGGSWQLVSDPTAAGGTRIWNPDAGVGKLASASASPASHVDVTFNAKAGVPYHVWLRMKADNDSWQNDSVFLQFSDSVDGSGNPVWRIGSTGATVVSLEDCSGCGEQGWGWNDNGYNTAATPVVFATTGPHTIRIQQREDGVSIDQIVLSAVRYVNRAPGVAKSDTTIVAK